MDDATLLSAVEAAVREAFAEMLPGVALEVRADGEVERGLGDYAIVALSGYLCGFLAIQTPRESTRALARRIAGDLINDDDGEMAPGGFLTLLEQDSLRELSNRIGCILAGRLTRGDRRLSPTFPIFVYGNCVNVEAASDHRVGRVFVVDHSIPMAARACLSTPKPSATRAEQIRDLERLREELLASERH